MSVSIQETMSAQLDNMFKKMSGPGREKELKKQQELINFANDFSQKQKRYIDEKASEKSSLPQVNKKWGSPQTVDEANKQFDTFVLFSHKKSKEIEQKTKKLQEFNLEMNTAISSLKRTIS